MKKDVVLVYSLGYVICRTNLIVHLRTEKVRCTTKPVKILANTHIVVLALRVIKYRYGCQKLVMVSALRFWWFYTTIVIFPLNEYSCHLAQGNKKAIWVSKSS